LGRQEHRHYMVLTGMANLAIILCLLGKLDQAEQICNDGILLVREHKLEYSPMTADLFLCSGLLHYERHNLEEAEKYSQQGLKFAEEQNFIWAMVWGYQAQARIFLAKGDLERAENSLQAALQLEQAHEIPEYLICETAGLLAEIWIHHGQLDRAEQYLTQRGINADGDINFPHQVEYLALARLHRSKGDLALAAKMLERILIWAETQQQIRTIMAASVSLALINHAIGNFQQSLTIFDRVLALAEQEGYFQTIVGEGEAVIALLNESINQKIHVDYSGRLLGVFPPVRGSGLEGTQRMDRIEGTQIVGSGTDFYIEPLSRREMEVLQLIAEGYSNKEIAQKLYLSLRTIKYYSTGLYNKLGGDNRMQAVIRAREAGLLKL